MERAEPLRGPNLGCFHGGLGDGCAELGLAGTGQCETRHKLISRQGLVAGTSILVFGLFLGVLRVGCALREE